MTAVLGIDNGLDGAVVAIDAESGRVLGFFDAPVVELGKSRRQLAPRSMAVALDALLEQVGPVVGCFVEHGQPIGSDGTIANWHSGASYLGWRCLLAARGLPWQDVPAQQWQRELLRGAPGEDTKAKSLHRAQGLFPGLPLMKPNGRKLSLHGRSDAALIAEYGRRLLAGKAEDDA